MLILSRRFRQSIVIDGLIKVTVVSITPDQVQLGVHAPHSVVVDREEIHLRKCREVRARRRFAHLRGRNEPLVVHQREADDAAAQEQPQGCSFCKAES